MTDIALKHFNNYVLQALAESEQKEETIEALVFRLTDRTEKAEIRLHEVESKVVQLQTVICNLEREGQKPISEKRKSD